MGGAKKKVGQFIHEVDDGFEIESGTDVGCEWGMKDENDIGRSRRKENVLRKVQALAADERK